MQTTRECFTCERIFSPTEALAKNVPLDYCETYCSYECCQELVDSMQAEIQKAKDCGLIDQDGVPILHTTVTPSQVRDAIAQFNLKIKS